MSRCHYLYPPPPRVSPLQVKTFFSLLGGESLKYFSFRLQISTSPSLFPPYILRRTNRFQVRAPSLPFRMTFARGAAHSEAIFSAHFFYDRAVSYSFPLPYFSPGTRFAENFSPPRTWPRFSPVCRFVRASLRLLERNVWFRPLPTGFPSLNRLIFGAPFAEVLGADAFLI